MSEQNKAIVRRLFEELWNKGDLSVAGELFAPNYTHHDPSTPDFGRGPESERKRATLYRTAFPDPQLTIEDIIAEGETVTGSTGGPEPLRLGGAVLYFGHRRWPRASGEKEPTTYYALSARREA